MYFIGCLVLFLAAPLDFPSEENLRSAFALALPESSFSWATLPARAAHVLLEIKPSHPLKVS
ncbi:MAG: hypothetical protein NTW13_06660 [Candidatus Omnitrophica bacterium]|nr:hypothetical protein [Candidatus Omnitrophota bacterium]